jgi:phosphate transport system substrate-binding protein
VRRLLLLAGVLLAPLLTVFAQLPPAAPSANPGPIAISGDSSLVPLTQNIITLYTLEGYTGSASVTAAPVANAFAGLCTGSVDVVLSARLINADEQNACVANVFTPIAFQIGTDALIIVASPQNSFLQDLTSQQLQQAFSTGLNWNEINGGFPGVPINRYLPASDTGEFDFFARAVFGGDQSLPLAATNATLNTDLNALMQLIGQDPNGIGILPASLANRNSSVVRPVSLDGNAPNTQNVTEGLYGLSRGLFLYTAKELFQEKPQVADFLNYYISSATAEVAPLGLYPASGSIWQGALSAWLNANGVVPTPTPAVPLPTLAVPPTAGPLPTATAFGAENITPTPVVSAVAQDTITLLVDARADLETLASNTVGLDRPEGWSGSLDTTNPQLALLIRLDLETLASALLGVDQRPTGWFGAVPSTQFAIARDIRHDLELLADNQLEGGVRPQGWVGALPIFRCDRATQTLANLLQSGGVFVVTTSSTDPNYCQKVAVEVSVYSEGNLLNNTEGGAIFSNVVQSSVAGAFTIDTNFAIAFTDKSARNQVGIIPFDTAVKPVARSTTQFSNMVLVQGTDFLLFVDYNDTTLTEDEFDDLPGSEQIPTQPFCDAEFCSGG